MLAERMTRVSASPTQQVLLEAQRLRRQGIDVVDFGAGEPDFATPAHVKAAAVEAIDTDFTKYTPNAGIADLKDAIGASYRAMYGVEYGPSETIVTAGGKQALYNAVLALFGSGDEVITHAPGVADDRRTDQARRCRAGDCSDGSGRRVPGQGRRGAERDHAADSRYHPQLAGEPDRRARDGRGPHRPLPTRWPRAVSGSSWISAMSS